MKKLLTIMALIATTATFAQTYQKYGDVVFPAEGEGHPKITQNTKIVYLEKDPNTYSRQLIMDCTDFQDGIAYFKDPKSKMWGTIDMLGNIVREPFLVQGYGGIEFPTYVDGYAFAEAPQGELGYNLIDKMGNIIKKFPKIYKIGKYNFKDGYVGVLYNGDNYSGYKYGFIDFKGNVVYPKTSATARYAQAPTAYHFGDGLAPYKDQTTNLWGYFNESGAIIIKPQFTDASIFSEGLAAVCKNGKWGFIDRTGTAVIDFQYEARPSEFHSGYAVFEKRSGVKKYIINTEGAIVKECFQYTHFNSNGFGLTEVEVDIPGVRAMKNILIDSNFQEVANFGVLDMVTSDNKQTLFDYGSFYVLEPQSYTATYVTDKEFKVKFKAYSIDKFCDGLAFILFDLPDMPRQSGYVDKDGEVKILFKYK